MSADQMADLFRKILGVISGTFQGLSHEQYVEAFLARHTVVIFQVSEKDEVAQTVELGIGTQYRDGAIEIALAEGVVHITQHLLQSRGHQCEVANILQLNPAAHGRCPIAAVQQQVSNAFQIDDELETSQELAGVFRPDLRDNRGYPLVDLMVECVQFFFAGPHAVENGHHAGCNSLSDDTGCDPCDPACL